MGGLRTTTARAFAALVLSALSAALLAGPAGAKPRPSGDGLAALAQQSLRAPVTGERFYFLMADRFANGRADNDRGGLGDDRLVSGFDPTHRGFYHGGDLKGVLDQIDYIAGLGTSAIWLTPSFKNKAVQLEDGPSAGYHGYWITDFTQIDPHLGTNAELRALVEAAHARGMKVYFDIITNHTADVIAFREGSRPGYVGKDAEPYRDASGRPFDDRDFAGTSRFPELDPATSFPYTPFVPDGAPRKVPGWLNDVNLYHNRGNTTFTGEDSLYGDFFGLDDLFTEHPRVVQGMIDVYKAWIRDFRIDGFRIDTMKHVDDAFWQRFAPEVLSFARSQGKSEFFMFGEVFDTTRDFTSHFTTRDRVQAVLDFPFQAAAQGFAAESRPTTALRDLFVGDDWYTDADSNAYQLPTFLGNHDMGRIGRFVQVANPGAPDAELLARDRLAHELMYLSRGNPVVFYGDEQGFTGDGGDQLARQDMFPSRVAEYNDDDLIGTSATTAASNFDRSHPLYRAIGRLAALTREHPALRDGVHQHRYATDAAGIYAFSRIDRERSREYVVALNNSERTQSAAVPTYIPKRRFSPVYGEGARAAKTDAAGRLRVVVPPLSAVVLRSSGRIPRSKAAPAIALAAPAAGEEVRDRAEVRADVAGRSPYAVTFLAKVGDGPWRAIGTDDNAPYRVFHDVAGLEPGTPLQYRAVVLDNGGHRRVSDARFARVGPPAVTLRSPADGARVRDRVDLAADVVPDSSDVAVTFQRRVGDGAWTTIGRDDSAPSPYRFTDDVRGLADGTRVAYRAISGGVTSASHAVTVVSSRVTVARVHYRRPAGNYADWGLHLWGDAISPEVRDSVRWDDPFDPTGFDDYGAVFEIPLEDDTKPVNFIVHKPNGDSVPETREPGGDRSFVPLEHPEVWLVQGDPAVYTSPPS